MGRLPATQVTAESPVEETEPIGPVPQGPFLNEMRLVETLQFLGDALIWILLYLAPILILILLPLVALVWFINRLRRKKKQA